MPIDYSEISLETTDSNAKLVALHRCLDRFIARRVFNEGQEFALDTAFNVEGERRKDTDFSVVTRHMATIEPESRQFFSPVLRLCDDRRFDNFEGAKDFAAGNSTTT